ncbi:unnamed protein product [Rotaria sordida]|uniref:Uncharacterized protein n=1 Tax=Rotaria sordida TaxID=392033 RepID=A0A819NCI3_9BILA|nr:unnamed protein product [Rotaria sordida]CAF1439444.1 unnamed protein product [Rotaria sordida]CAF1507747.1 unnamed protein product [Rotaria sordida]CAF1521541.1 unnamed protein product [Rotaria sordida]CAF1627241.1 unnamed protein product [Rotaria sordida]
MGCSKEYSNRVWIKLVFLKNNYLWIDSHEMFSSQVKPRTMSSITGEIPHHTRFIRIELHTNISDASTFCVIHNIKLNIFYAKH